MRSNRGFSLVEILVVMAISVILVGLVLAPVMQSFRMTRQAQAMIDAQDAARLGMEQISRELGEAMYVFDNSVVPVTIYDDGTTPAFTYHDGEQGPIQLPVRQFADNIECFTLPFGKIDFVLPKMTMHCNNPAHPSGKPRDYPRYIVQNGRKYYEAWPPCPVCSAAGLVADNVSAVPKMPLEQDATIVRYFLGLRYNNPNYDGLNPPPPPPPGEGLFGWRSPWEGQVEPGAENQVVLYRVEFDPHDPALFPAKPAGMTDDEWLQAKLSDPIFFYRTAPNGESTAVPCCERWMEIARVIGIGKYQDLIIGTFSSGSGDATAVEPSITFRFQAINNDTFEGAYSNDRSFDYPNAVPAAYLASYGYWIDNHPSPAGANDNPNWEVTIYRNDNTIAYSTEVDGSGHLLVRKREFTRGAWQAPSTTFDLTRYVTNGEITSGGNDAVEMAFTIDLNRGKVEFALDPPHANPDRTGPVCILDPAAINTAFHNVYEGMVGLADRGSARRMALLTTFDPTDPGPPPKPNPAYLPNARVVPGSERVAGPNMTPGAGYGWLIRYERVPLALGDPGLNQYKIDYDTGRLIFSADFRHDIPERDNNQNPARVLVDYKVHFNRDADIVKGDYTTKSLVTVHMGIRMFDPETAKPHAVDLTNSIKVRNAHR